jgi:hypothetical protein
LPLRIAASGCARRCDTIFRSSLELTTACTLEKI